MIPLRRTVISIAMLCVTAALAACGGNGHIDHNAAGSRTIEIDMRDNDFSSASIEVKAGEPVQFVFHNNGALAHDAYIGDDAAQAAHEQEMRMSSGEAGHGAHGGDGVTVEPGQTGTLTHTFDKPGTTIIGCHQLNHYSLGMRINVNVT